MGWSHTNAPHRRLLALFQTFQCFKPFSEIFLHLANLSANRALISPTLSRTAHMPHLACDPHPGTNHTVSTRTPSMSIMSGAPSGLKASRAAPKSGPCTRAWLRFQ